MPDPSPPRRLLIVDDEQDTAKVLARLAERYGFESRFAFTSSDAIDLLASFAPEVLLVDFGLAPGDSGMGVVRAARECEQTQDALIIMLSGFSPEIHQQQCLAAGADLYLLKPVEFGKIADLVNSRPARLVAG